MSILLVNIEYGYDGSSFLLVWCLYDILEFINMLFYVLKLRNIHWLFLGTWLLVVLMFGIGLRFIFSLLLAFLLFICLLNKLCFFVLLLLIYGLLLKLLSLSLLSFDLLFNLQLNLCLFYSFLFIPLLKSSLNNIYSESSALRAETTVYLWF